MHKGCYPVSGKPVGVCGRRRGHRGCVRGAFRERGRSDALRVTSPPQRGLGGQCRTPAHRGRHKQNVKHKVHPAWAGERATCPPEAATAPSAAAANLAAAVAAAVSCSRAAPRFVASRAELASLHAPERPCVRGKVCALICGGGGRCGRTMGEPGRSQRGCGGSGGHRLRRVGAAIRPLWTAARNARARVPSTSYDTCWDRMTAVRMPWVSHPGAFNRHSLAAAAEA